MLQLFETGKSHMALLVRPKGSGDLRAMRRYTTLASEENEGYRKGMRESQGLDFIYTV